MIKIKYNWKFCIIGYNFDFKNSYGLARIYFLFFYLEFDKRKFKQSKLGQFLCWHKPVIRYNAEKKGYLTCLKCSKILAE